MLSNLKARWLGVTILLDIGLTILALLLARWLREYFPAGVYFDSLKTFSFTFLDEPLFFSPLFLIPIVIIVWLIVFSSLSIYSARFTVAQYNQAQPIFIAVTGAVLVFAGLAYFLFRNLSRILFLYFYIFDVVLLISWRKLVFRSLQESVLRSWQPRHRVLIVGQGQLANNVASAIEAFAWSGLELLGFAGDEQDAIGSLDEIPALVSKLEVDEVIFALPPGHQSLLQKLVFELQPLSVNLRLVPDVIDLVFVRATIEDFAGLPLIGLRQPAIDALDRLVKRTFDITASIFFLLLFAPVVLIVILLIKLNADASKRQVKQSSEGRSPRSPSFPKPGSDSLNTKGSVFYTSQRVGEGGKIFKMYKFRTMIDDADQRESDLFYQTDKTMGFNKRPNDPRITRIGQFLRRTSIDELPQLINVIKGDMSLVGPRPELPWLVDRYKPWQYQRFTVPQGLTGWWQVKNRGNQHSYDVRVEDDLYYIHNYSFLLDLRILFLTLGAIIRGDGAY